MPMVVGVGGVETCTSKCFGLSCGSRHRVGGQMVFQNVSHERGC